MKTFLISICVAVSLSALAADLSDDEKKAGFKPLFNGKDFAGWRFAGGTGNTAPNWKVEGGLIKLSGGGNPHLATESEFGDFELRFEWRAVGDKYNSGLFIRSRPTLGQNQLNLAKGGEGAFIGGKIEGAKGVPDLQKPAGEWNEWRVRAVGEKVSFWCNGKLAWEATGFKSPKGHIGLQAEGAAMEFRNVRLNEIKTP
ncbi:MAG: DUF1080 domain-containing protein [Pedosphaera sp.]|nr:DUF1080 domain-containing protein [Pedosphaera sp.]